MPTTLVARWWNGRRGEEQQDIWLYRDGTTWYVTIREGGPGNELHRWACDSERAGRRWVLDLRANSHVGITGWVDVAPERQVLEVAGLAA